MARRRLQRSCPAEPDAFPARASGVLLLGQQRCWPTAAQATISDQNGPAELSRALARSVLNAGAMSRNAEQWERRPPLPPTHYVDTRLYTDPQIFAEEREKIFARTWIIAAHESELPAAHDYRTFQHPAGRNLLLVRGDDGSVRAFFNICPHRGNALVHEPSGNARALTCIFHAWTFDGHGRCTGIARRKEGYQDRLHAGDLGLRAVRCELGHGGFVWVNVDDSAPPLADSIGDALGLLAPHLQAPLEVFHYQKVVVNTNHKLWHDTNSEFYHDYLHYFNRVTGMQQPGYFDRRYVGYPNGHASVGSMQVRYDKYAGGQERAVGWPGLAPGGWILVDLFPGMTYNLRTSVIRLDTIIPVAPNRTIIELRGLALASDTPDERAARVRDHNTIWGPFGRNLHEDLLAVRGQGQAMRDGDTGSRWLLHGREEDMTIHDEGGMRHYYAEWSRRMARSPSDPFAGSTP
jgi:methanesulfonate monooxygenase large subunit